MPLSESIPAIILTSAIDRVNAAGVQPICSMSSICDGANAGAIPFRRSFWVVIEAGGVEMVFIGSTSFRSDATIRRLLKCAIR
jgi:hypothetical protein